MIYIILMCYSIPIIRRLGCQALRQNIPVLYINTLISSRHSFQLLFALMYKGGVYRDRL
jgi:hypothetical protein